MEKQIKETPFKFYFSNSYIAWNNDTINVPNLDRFNVVSWKEYLPDAPFPVASPINWTGEFSGTIKMDNTYGSITFFKLFLTPSQTTTYYQVVSVNKIMSNFTIYNIEVDIWATYMVKQLSDKTPELLVLRTPNINPLAYQLTDPLIDGIVKQDSIKGYVGSPIDNIHEIGCATYSSPSGKQLIYYEGCPENQMAGNYYALFKDLPDKWERVSSTFKKNNILALPFLGKITPSNAEMKIKAPMTDGKEETHSFAIYIGASSADYSQRDAAEVISSKWKSQGYDVEWMPTETYRYQLPVNSPPALLRGGKPPGYMAFMYYNKEFTIDSKKITGLPLGATFYYTIKKVSKPNGFQYYKVHNYEDRLRKLVVGDETNSNANAVFMGFYHLPCFYYLMGDLNIIKDNVSLDSYVCIELSVFGNNISNMLVGNYDLTNSDYIKYFEMKYYDNAGINWGYFWNKDTKNIVLNGNLVFNETGGVIIASNTILNEDKSIISYGGELPSARKEYIDYLNNNRSSINNGIRQQKIQYKMSLATGILGGLGKGAAVGLGSAAASGGIGIASAVVGAVGGAASIATGIAGTVMNNKAYYSGLKAKHEDLQRNSGVVFSTSDTEDMANTITNSLNVLGELAKITIPSDDTLAMMNAMNEKYGYLNPKITTIPFKDGIGYYAFDINFLSEWLDTNYLTIRSVKDAILKRVENGIRLFRTNTKGD